MNKCELHHRVGSACRDKAAEQNARIVAPSLKKMLLILPEKAKRVHIHNNDDDEGKENGGLRWDFLVDIASGVRLRIR